MGILRSWWKQERAALLQARWRSTFLIGAGLVVASITFEGFRRYENVQQLALEHQKQNLDLLHWQVRETKRTSQDWAHWNDSLAFVEGRNPEFPHKDMGTTALLNEGAVMAIFGEQGQRLAIAGATPDDRREDSPLSQCLRDVDNRRRQHKQTQIDAICPGQDQFYVGNFETISDNNSVRSTQASLAYLAPMLSQPGESPMAIAMAELHRQLNLSTDQSASPSSTTLINPNLWTIGGRRAAVARPPLGGGWQRELLALAGLVGGSLALGLTLRLQWMLAQRRQQLERRLRERMVNQRLRHSETELTSLLEKVQISNRDDEIGAFARMLERNLHTSNEPFHGTDRHERLALRIEQVLDSARSLLLLDALTGLPNRNFFLERLNWESEKSRAQGKPLALLFINIDKFKRINESYGHNTGDDVLRHVSNELRGIVGDRAFLARFGGDEFSLILDSSLVEGQDQATIREHAHQQALGLLETFHRNSKRGNQQEHLKVNLSIGIAISDSHGTSAEELIRRSDMAMTIAKTRRSERVSIFDMGQEIDSLNDYRLYNALQSDLTHHPERFTVLFQPIVDCEGKTRKFEALSRWHNPEFLDVPPDLFFNVAERYRLILELGNLILSRTFTAFQKLHEGLGDDELQLAINVSPSQLAEASFAADLLSQLERIAVTPECLTIEVTESTVVEANEEFNTNLNKLRAVGIRLALDDFGIGYSSLRLLMWLKPDEIKIDKSFVLAASQDVVANQIVRLLQQLADQMCLSLVAEGVEQQHVLLLLQEAGLSRFQGFLFSRAQTIEALLERHRETHPPTLAT